MAQPASSAAARAHLRAVEAPVSAQAAPTQGDTPGETSATDPRFRRQALLEAVCATTPIKRSDAKTFVEVVLLELARAIDTHDELILPPLGKISVKRRNAEAAGGDVLTIRLKRSSDATSAADDKETPLAAADDDG